MAVAFTKLAPLALNRAAHDAASVAAWAAGVLDHCETVNRGMKSLYPQGPPLSGETLGKFSLVHVENAPLQYSC